MRRKGLLRARQFSWEQSVARTWDIYQEIGAGRQETGDRGQETGDTNEKGRRRQDARDGATGGRNGQDDASVRSATRP
jgi:hypothetical protein